MCARPTGSPRRPPAPHSRRGGPNTRPKAALSPAENTAARLLASEISNSWGGPEPGADSPAFNHPGVVITASSGDNGYLDWLGSERHVNYPASSPHVGAGGGTRLLQSKGIWYSESGWNDGGLKESKKTGAGASRGGRTTGFTPPPAPQGV